MKKPVLALVPSAYKTSKVYSVLPVNGDGDFTFSRTGSGTRVKENGLIETITGSNDPRLNWDGECPSLLCEPQKTNYCIFGNTLDNWTIMNTNAAITKTPDWSVAPNGIKEAARLEVSLTGTTGSLGIIAQTSFGLVGNYTASIYIKSNTSSSQDVVVVARNSVEQSYSIGSEWTRIEVQGSNLGGESAYIDIGLWYDIAVPTGDLDISLWGGQIEAGLSATSFINIPSYQAQTRNKEHTIISELTEETQFNHKEGVMFIDVEPYEVDPTQSATLHSQIKLVGGSNQIYFEFKPSRFIEFYGNNAPAPAIFSYNYQTIGGRTKAAIGWYYGDYRLFINGQLLTSYSGTGREFTNFQELLFEQLTNTKEFKGKVYGVQVFDKLLSDAEIKKLTEL